MRHGNARAPIRAIGSVGTPVVMVLAVLFAGCAESDPPALSSARAPAKAVHSPAEDERLKDLFNAGASAAAKTPARILPRFRDIASDAGIEFRRFNDTVPGRYFLPEIMGGGVAWFDYDADGWLDLYATNGCHLWDPDPSGTQHFDSLYRNLGNGLFQEVSIPSGARDNRYGQGCAVADFNADGFPDLFVGNYGRSTLFVNCGDGTFIDHTTDAGVPLESWSTSPVWVDANDDGYVDLFVVTYLNVTRQNHKTCTYNGTVGYCGPGQWDEVFDDVLFLSLGDGSFQAAPPPAGAENRNSKGLAVAVCDFDGDSRPEIFVANDMAPNFLLTRTPVTGASGPDAPLYRNVADVAGCALSGDGRNQAGMGLACSDFDGDGRVDVFMTGYYHAKNTLYRNLGGLTFEDDSRRTRIAAASFESLGFGAVAADFDHDGDDDLFVANGHVLGPDYQPFEMTQQLLENDGTGLFSDVSAFAGDYFAKPCLGRGVAAGDFDNDGRVDLAVNHLDRPLAVLLNETESPHQFIGIELMAANRIYPAGGRLIVSAGSKRRVIPIVDGESYLSSGDPRIVVGLENITEPVRVEVVWPGRSSQTFERLSPGRYWLLREGQEALARR
jgi:enediyne biosynthesis protein E4